MFQEGKYFILPSVFRLINHLEVRHCRALSLEGMAG
jgi:hypothetical protein